MRLNEDFVIADVEINNRDAVGHFVFSCRIGFSSLKGGKRF